MLLLFSDPVVGEKYPWILSGPFPLNKLLLLITDIVEMLLEPGKVLWSVLLRITTFYTFLKLYFDFNKSAHFSTPPKCH